MAQWLAPAYRLLGNPRRRAEKVRALDCGFADVSYFSRAVPRRYGVASDVRAQAQEATFRD